MAISSRILGRGKKKRGKIGGGKEQRESMLWLFLPVLKDMVYLSYACITLQMASKQNKEQTC